MKILLIPGVAALAAATLAAMPAAAQPDARAGANLSQAMNTLASDPQNVRALVLAGQSALALDDVNGALAFFARAEQVDPRNAQVKAGLARAMLASEKPREALKLFDDAIDLGVPEIEIAGDRGLAYDLRGDPRRAQRDYALALRRGPDPEVTRRMALSMAISGERDQAIDLLDPLLRQQDRAAWRARAFILAMTGDVAGANNVAATVMPANLSRPMQPFFARLPSLSSAQKAAAVHFGHMPASGRGTQSFAAADTRSPAQPVRPSVAEPMVAATPTPLATAPRRDAPQIETVPARPVSAPVRMAARTTPPAATPPATRTPATRAPFGPPAPLQRDIPTVRDDDPAPGFSQPVTTAATEPVRIAQASAPPVASAIQGALAPIAPSTAPSPQPSTTPVRAVEPVPAPTPGPAKPTPLERSLASIVGDLELEKADHAELPVARVPAPKQAADPRKEADKKAADKKAADKKAADKKLADAKKAAAKPDPKKQFPERIWAQIATGANASALATDYGKMVKKSPAAFRGMTSWTVPFGRTRRLLVGPFPSQGKASEFLKKAGITGFAWTSPAGTEIEKLAAR